MVSSWASLLPLLLSSLPQSEASPAADLLGRGKELEERGRLLEALDAYEGALRLEPTHRIALFRKGSILLDMRRSTEAAETLEKAKALHPRDERIRTQLGLALWRNGRLEEAEQALREAIDVEPSYSISYLFLAEILGERGRHAEQIEVLKQASVRCAGSPVVLGRLGSALSDAGRLDEALDTLRRAAAADPASSEVRLALGLALLRSGDLEGAIAELERASVERPADRTAWYNLGKVYAALGRTGESRDAFTRFRRLHELWQERERALQGLAGYPDHPGPRLALARVSLEMGNVQEADRYLAGIPEEFRGGDAYLDLSGRIALAQGDVPRAVELLGRLVARDPADASARIALGRAHLAAGRLEEAALEFEAARRLDPGSEEAGDLLRQVREGPRTKGQGR